MNYLQLSLCQEEEGRWSVEGCVIMSGLMSPADENNELIWADENNELIWSDETGARVTVKPPFWSHGLLVVYHKQFYSGAFDPNHLSYTFHKVDEGDAMWESVPLGDGGWRDRYGVTADGLQKLNTAQDGYTRYIYLWKSHGGMWDEPVDFSKASQEIDLRSTLCVAVYSDPS